MDQDGGITWHEWVALGSLSNAEWQVGLVKKLVGAEKRGAGQRLPSLTKKYNSAVPLVNQVGADCHGLQLIKDPRSHVRIVCAKQTVGT